MASNRPSIRNSRFAYAKTVVKMSEEALIPLVNSSSVRTMLFFDLFFFLILDFLPFYSEPIFHQYYIYILLQLSLIERTTSKQLEIELYTPYSMV